MAERMVFDDLRKSMGKSLIWAHEPKTLVGAFHCCGVTQQSHC